MSMEYWWDGPDRKKLKYSEERPVQMPQVSPHILGEQVWD
jgi:hypothetical protein